MAKRKTAFFCQNCGTESPKWLGKCPACGAWNTYVEEVLSTEKQTPWSGEADVKKSAAKPLKLNEITVENDSRWGIHDQELNRVLGNGIVPGSMILLGGEPGIGKSTLLLQVALTLTGRKLLYVSGEESLQQIKLRASRMPFENDNLYFLSETSIDRIFEQIKHLNPALLIIDSIQTIFSEQLDAAPGSVSQVRFCVGELMKFAKESNVPVFLIGHITKDGSIAGPKVLEHMVDTVIEFEGDRHLTYRILRATKNRFGSTAELGIYEMNQQGLRQVSNPSEILISQRDHASSGVTIGASLEGNRPLLVELQSLVSPATYGTPQRSSTGFDTRRLNMLLAVIEKRAGFRLGTQDVFFNVAGGIKIEDPAIDLAVCMSVISSFNDLPVSDKVCFASEVGLGGEIRAVNRIENRIAEAAKLGFESIVISKYNKKSAGKSASIDVRSFAKLEEVISHLMG